MMRMAGNAGLMVALLTVSGCFRAEAPRQAAPPAGDDASAASPAEALTGNVVTGDEEPPQAPDLAAALRASEEPAMRREAVYAMADAGNEADTGFVGQALADPDPKVRHAAIEALTGFESATAVSYLALALNDVDPRIRLDAVEALGNFGSGDARQALEQGLIDSDDEVRAAAAQMLAEPERR